jgi:hypothetical protein
MFKRWYGRSEGQDLRAMLLESDVERRPLDPRPSLSAFAAAHVRVKVRRQADITAGVTHFRPAAGRVLLLRSRGWGTLVSAWKR